jgi:HK97 gp10 family phage protein
MAEVENVTGLRELEAALKSLPDRVARNVLRGAVAAGAAVVRKEARDLAPKSEGPQPEGHVSGTLKRAIYQKQIRERSSLLQQTFFVGVRRGRSAKSTVKGVIDAWYAHFVEFGTSKMEARPFMRPAFESRKAGAVEAIKSYLLSRIPKEVEKLRP